MLPEYGSGELGSENRARIERHLRDCAACREFVRASEHLRAGLQACMESESQRHVAEEALVKYSENPDALEGSARDSLETHLLYCTTCMRELELLTELNRSVGVSAAGEPDRSVRSRTDKRIFRFVPSRFASAYAVAAAVILLLGYSAGRYWPETKTPALPDVPEFATETVFGLAEQTRTSLREPTIARSRGSDVLRFAFTFWPDTNRSYTVTIDGIPGDRILETVLADTQVRAGRAQIAIAAHLLQDGRWTLVLQGIGRSDPTDTLRTYFPFRLETLP